MIINESTHKDNSNCVLSKDFWNACSVKVITTLLSVKVWGLVACFTIPTILLVKGHIDPTAWVSGFTTVPAVIYGMREIFKISSIWDNFKKTKTEPATSETTDEG